MPSFTRRQFAAAFALGATSRSIFAKGLSLDDVLSKGIAARQIPCAVAMVANSSRILYQGAFGARYPESPATLDTIFAIASMTKAITTAASLQLVERGMVKLDEPVERHLPALRGIGVLVGYDGAGEPVLRPPVRKVTLRHLLTHTSGLCYANWDKDMARWQGRPGATPLARVAPVTPLMFDPGTRWQYGTGIDFAGKLVEAITGQTLEGYFQHDLLGPLEMTDTSFFIPREKFARLATRYRRQGDGPLTMDERALPAPATEFNGGGGLYSTCSDYVKFMQMILRHGARNGSSGYGQVLSANTVAAMSTNQIGNVRAGILQSTNPGISSDMDAHPGASDRFTLGFLMNPEAHRGGRAAGSLAWAGINNTFYWIDPLNDRCAVLMMQFLPFVDREAVGLLNDFEQGVYATL